MIIELKNGQKYDISDYKLKRLFHFIPSPSVVNASFTVDGRSDLITNTKLNNRVIEVEFLFEAYDIYEYYSLRENLINLFSIDDYFYITFKREPHKRWKVRLNSGFNIPPSPSMNSFSIQFITCDLYAESTFTSNEFSKEWDSGVNSWNGLINWDGQPPSYNFVQNEFNVVNLGNAVIDPRTNFLEIRITGNVSSRLTITNRTKNESYVIDSNFFRGDNLLISGVNSTLNDQNVFHLTNKKLLTLDPGDNFFTLQGITNPIINFNFRYLFK